MASAILGGLLRRGLPASHIQVVEPFADQRARLAQQFGVRVSEAPDASLGDAEVVAWAVKPQTFRDAAQQCRMHTGKALHLSVAAGIRSDTIAGWLGTDRVVRTMPNTPALIGKGMTALFARPGATENDQLVVERIVGTMGEFMWLKAEELLDAVTALSGSGPAYVFYFLEAMVQAGTDMGLDPAQAHRLAIATFSGASALAQEATDPPEVLRAQVTSRGGTTHAALTLMEQDGIKAKFMQAMQAARLRAGEMGDEFGGLN